MRKVSYIEQIKEMSELKQVILVRKDLKMSVGKTAAQVAHASMGVFFNLMKNVPHGKFLRLTRYERSWVDGRFTKLVKGVKNESQLLAAHEKAKEMGINCCLIKDAALTELDEPSFTCLALGPDDFDKIQKITKRFQLLK